jgi:hypothetical protein
MSPWLSSALGVSTPPAMSSTRTLDSRFAWTDKDRVIELLDWATNPEDFDRLCQHVIGLLHDRGHWTRAKLFALITEEQLRREIRATAERFHERFVSLPMFIYVWLHTARLPQISRQNRGER